MFFSIPYETFDSDSKKMSKNYFNENWPRHLGLKVIFSSDSLFNLFLKSQSLAKNLFFYIISGEFVKKLNSSIISLIVIKFARIQ